MKVAQIKGRLENDDEDFIEKGLGLHLGIE